MTEEINWQKELESQKFNDKFSKIFEHEQKLYARNLSWIYVFQMEKNKRFR